MASLGIKSVVKIPIAAFIQIYLFWVYFIFLIKSGIEEEILSLGNFSPIVPVHAKIISEDFTLDGFSSSIFCFSESLLDISSANIFKLL